MPSGPESERWRRMGEEREGEYIRNLNKRGGNKGKEEENQRDGGILDKRYTWLEGMNQQIRDDDMVEGGKTEREGWIYFALD